MRTRRVDGYILFETLVASVIVVALAASVAQVVSMTSASVRASRARGVALFLAVQKLEQLKSLSWTFNTMLRPYSDYRTNLAFDPPTTHGPGLRPSPAAALRLDANLTGYVDYLDEHGRWLGTGSRPPAGTSYVRRWSVRALPAPAADGLVVDVLVVAAGAGMPSPQRAFRANDPGVTLLTTVRSRR